MKLYLDQRRYIDTSEPLDISMTLRNDEQNVRAWYVDPPVMEPVRTDAFTGAVAEGGAVNFRNIFFNPHGHGTHTECLGHITKEVYSVNESLTDFFFQAIVITIDPTSYNGDQVLLAKDVNEALKGRSCEALIIRTLPNGVEKQHRNYSATNPPYLELDAIEPINTAGVKHLLIDLPSVDREEDGGELVFHHAFWQVPQNPQYDKTITEFIYVNDEIEDGEYILELQVAAFRNDAAPSRPVLYKIKEG